MMAHASVGGRASLTRSWPLLRSLFGAVQSISKQDPSVPPGGELKKDPVCGTYVSATTSLNQKVAGELVYFCSPECQAKFRR